VGRCNAEDKTENNQETKAGGDDPHVRPAGKTSEAEPSCRRNERCHEGQGFLFSRARPNAEIISLLQVQRGENSSFARNDGESYFRFPK